MDPIPHEGAETDGATRSTVSPLAPRTLDPLPPFRTLLDAADAAAATTAFTANQALTSQIALAHILAGAAKRLAAAWTVVAASLPEGGASRSLAWFAQCQANSADAVMDAASQVGRRFGRLAFAFPPTASR